MDITWLGLSCLRIKGRDTAVITDPFPKAGGLSMGKQSAQIVTISNLHPQHSYIEGVTGEPKVLNAPGEYEVSGLSIIGLNSKTGEGTKNTLFLFDVEDVSICHLGSFGVVPSSKQMESLNGVDVLLVPVGSDRGLSLDQIVELIGQIEPKLIVPMHYRTDGIGEDLGDVEPFLKAMGLKDPEIKPKLTVTKGSLPGETQVALLSR